ncbi:two-component sensor histidine kinase [Bacillus sp. FJAT-42376]|uniref:ATP-binding protein n=1 Tax=Bacillus sp. FJAT-42376 TaxID=2014076 RepID=UPI000F503CBF|nr:ATP-binding protein [Bacillus sp. FJAT-42376]AZB42611.1 two-component sensor histidine kinase [Bacillus sp. FJAT-42376]
MLIYLKPLIVNMAILFSFTFNANLMFPFHSRKTIKVKQQVIYGLVSGFGAMLCMLYPIEDLGETYFDFRMIAILIVTLYSGWLAGGISLLFASVVRYGFGGEYVLIGMLINAAPYFIGLTFRNIYLKSKVRLAAGVFIILIYFFLYIWIVSSFIPFLDLEFYMIYFLFFFGVTMAMMAIIEALVRINRNLDNMVYLDKLTTIGQMAASIAHEIRNPITAVRGFIQFLQEDTSDEKLKEFSPLILGELDRTNKIITDYLKLAKPFEFELTRVKIDDLVKDSVDLLIPMATYENTEIQLELIPSNDVLGDGEHLKQAIMNVLKNSIESIEHGGKIKVVKKPDYFNGRVVLTITDNGKGMTEEQLQHIGLPFYTTKTKGTGIGTMIASRLIHDMDGEIEYSSKPGEGTEVTITLKAFTSLT